MEEIYKQEYEQGRGGGYGSGGGGRDGNGGSSSGLGSLNEEDYINKLYGENLESEKKLIEQNYSDNTGILNNEQTRVDEQTNQNIDRTQVESVNDTMNTYNGEKLSLGASQQAALAMENAKANNLNSLQEQRNILQEEIQRQRQLLASQYEAAIKQAQAENDMTKAQALYEAARKEDAQLLEHMTNVANIYAQYEDYSAMESLVSGGGRGGSGSADIGSGRTSAEVLKYEDEIRKMYDSKYAAADIELRTALEQKLSDLLAKQEEQGRLTDEKLTQTYVDALQSAKNYAEVQNARGMASGVYGQAQLAQDVELKDALTDLRLAQMEKDANYGVQQLEAYKDYSTSIQKKQAEINLQKALEMMEAAESVEEQNVAMQELRLQYELMMAALAAEQAAAGGGGYSSGTEPVGADYELSDVIDGIVSTGNSLTASGAQQVKQDVYDAIDAAVSDGLLTSKEAADMKSDLRGQVM